MSFSKNLDQVIPIALDNRGRAISEPSLNTEKQVIMENSYEELKYDSLDDTTNEAEFEFALEYYKLQHYMAKEFQNHQGTEMVWIHGTIDRETLKVTSVELGRKNI